MSFPTNTLPESFQEDHGTTSLLDDEEDEKAVGGAGGVVDEDLEMRDAGDRVWLCKIPKFLMEKWSSVQEEGAILGRVRVYNEKDSYGNPKIEVILPPTTPEFDPSLPIASTSSLPLTAPSSPAAPISSFEKRKRIADQLADFVRDNNVVPIEYQLTLQNTDSKNMFIFGEKEEDVQESGEVGYRKRRRITSMLGTVHHECSLTPSLKSGIDVAAYKNIMQTRSKEAAEPKRTIKSLDVDAGTANQLASGARLGSFKSSLGKGFGMPKPVASSGLRHARIPRNELLDALFKLFGSKPYWSLKAITEHVSQPQSYLKEVLGDIAQLLSRGPYANFYTLKDEYKSAGVPIAKKEEVKDEGATLGVGGRVVEDLDEGDDDDILMEEVELKT